MKITDANNVVNVAPGKKAISVGSISYEKEYKGDYFDLDARFRHFAWDLICIGFVALIRGQKWFCNKYKSGGEMW